MKTPSSALFGIVLLMTGLSLAPASAFGQGNTWVGMNLARMLDASRWRWGTLRINASMDITNAGYDTDVFFGYLDNPVPDITLSAGAPVQILWPVSKKIVVDLYDKPQYVFYVDTATERAFNNTFRGQIHFAFNRVYVQAEADYDNIRQRLSHELDLNVRQKSRGLNGLVLWQASRAASLALLYRRERYDFGDVDYGGMNIGAALGRTESSYDALAYIQPNSLVRFYVDGQYGTHVFAQSGPIRRDTRSYAVFGGVEFLPKIRETRRIEGVHGTLSLGYKRFDAVDPALRDDSGLAGKASLSAGLMVRTTARIFFSRDFQFSILSDATHYIALSYGGGITRLLSRKATASYDLLFGRSSYPQLSTGGEGLPPAGNNQFMTHMLSLEVRLARSLRILFLGSIGTRVVDTTGLTRSRDFVGFNLIYGTSPGTISTPMSSILR